MKIRKKSKYINKPFEYLTQNGEKRKAICKKITFHTKLKKPIFIGISPYGNRVELSKDEILRFL